jgi:ubiquinone/menaquinone biosynthesis C-methylase UbiE
MRKKATEQNFEAWNEEMLKKYDQDKYYTQSSWMIKFVENQRIKTVVRFIKAEPQDFILEVGCGAGYVLEKIPAGFLFGIDISEHILKKAYIRLGNRVFLTKSNAEYLPFKDGSFDKVYCTEVVEHVYNPQRLIEEMIRVVKPEGSIVLSAPNEKIINLLKDLLTKLHLYHFLLREGEYNMPLRMDKEYHLHTFTLRQLKDILKEHFKIEKILRIPYWFLPIRYVMLARKR